LLLLAVLFRSACCRGDVLIGSGAFGWKQRESYDAVCFKKLNVVIFKSVQVDSKKEALALAVLILLAFESVLSVTGAGILCSAIWIFFHLSLIAYIARCWQQYWWYHSSRIP
jgi:hypothetical protein